MFHLRGMKSFRISFLVALALSSALAETLAGEAIASRSTEHESNSAVHLIGEMRRMFTEHDIRPNVDLAKLTTNAHLYALGPLAGLKGEVTVMDGQVFVSKAVDTRPTVVLQPKVKTVFLVYASVPAWRSIPLPSNVVTELDLATFLQSQLPANSRSAFQVHGTAVRARYHIQNYHGKAKDLTHEAHDKAKVFFDLTNTPAELLGFFTNFEVDGGTFVHRGQTTHVHLISADRKHMGHLESIQLAPGATLLLPAGPTGESRKN
jgi:alpha-acetolactate decarboxylase